MTCRSLVDFVMRTEIDEDNQLFVGVGCMLECKDDPAVVLDPAGPEPLQAAVELVGAETRGLRPCRGLGQHNMPKSDKLLARRLPPKRPRRPPHDSGLDKPNLVC